MRSTDSTPVNKTVYTTIVQGTVVYEGESLSDAARVWDSVTHDAGHVVPGGIGVRVYLSDGTMVREGWIMHVHENGTVYLSPNSGLAP